MNLYEDSERTYTFSSSDASGTHTHTHEVTDGITWPEVTVLFLQFLRGCGFVVSSQEFIDEFHSQTEQYEEATSNDA